MLPARYLAYCPNCGGPIVEERLRAGLACARCQPDPKAPPAPGRLAAFAQARARVADWAGFFQGRVGSPPWPLQRAWAARVVKGRSFALLAPTGVGKTTFGLVTAAWLAKTGKRSALVFPTRLLVEEAARRLAALGVRAVAYTGKKREKEAIFSGDGPVQVFTVAFLYKNAERLPAPYPFVFVDDVDSLLKSAGNVDRVLRLLGFSGEDLEAGLKNLALRARDPVAAEARAERLREKARGVLAVASATARPRSRRVGLFRELLGFEVAAPSFALRKVADLYEPHFGEDEAARRLAALAWVRRLGGGGLVFLSGHRPKEAKDRLKAFLNDRGVAALAYDDPEALARFRAGEAEVLVGFASWRNPLARGLDLPERVRYALFLEVPRIELRLKAPEPEALLKVAVALLPLLRGDPLAAAVRRLARRRRPPEAEVRAVADATRKRLEDPAFRARIAQSPEVGLRFDGDDPVLVFADVTGYLQASGRTSRLTPAGLTQGLALLLADDEKAFFALSRRLGYLLEAPPKPVEAVDLDALLARVDEDRARLARGEGGGLRFPAEAVVVESPNKARTIAGFFGRPLRRYLPGLLVYEVLSEDRYLLVAATRGHVTDLAYTGGLYGVETGPELRPRYHPLRRCPEGPTPAEVCRDGRPSLPDRDRALRALQGLALEVAAFTLATDPDTEGEKIAWDVDLALAAFASRRRRAEFHAVTPRAFAEALDRPRDLLASRVDAQKVRRVADRWVGFALSERLQALLGRKTLSAGRVQTPVLGWVIERDRRSREKVVETEVELAGLRLAFPGEARGTTLGVELLDRRVEEVPPPPPFTTDTLLFEAGRAGFGVPRAMALAQDLFEAGLITYHRTDATRVSPEGMALAKRLVAERYGPAYARPRPWGTGGAHEAIRPARPMTPDDLEEALLTDPRGLGEAHLRLYRLIFDRFLASQMIPAQVERRRYRFVLGDASLVRELAVRLIEPGFSLAWPLALDPAPPPGRHRVAPRRVRRPAARPYTEGELVAEMKRRGLGRPSTYALIVERLLARRYLVKRGGRLFPTRLGKTVHRLLTGDGPLAGVARPYVEEGFTREVEAWMDRIEAGEDPRPLLARLLAATQAIRGFTDSNAESP